VRLLLAGGATASSMSCASTSYCAHMPGLESVPVATEQMAQMVTTQVAAACAVHASSGVCGAAPISYDDCTQIIPKLVPKVSTQVRVVEAPVAVADPVLTMVAPTYGAVCSHVVGYGLSERLQQASAAAAKELVVQGHGVYAMPTMVQEEASCGPDAAYQRCTCFKEQVKDLVSSQVYDGLSYKVGYPICVNTQLQLPMEQLHVTCDQTSFPQMRAPAVIAQPLVSVWMPSSCSVGSGCCAYSVSGVPHQFCRPKVEVVIPEPPTVPVAQCALVSCGVAIVYGCACPANNPTITPTCNESADCGGDRVCIDGVCQSECNDTNCSGGRQCVEGECKVINGLLTTPAPVQAPVTAAPVAAPVTAEPAPEPVATMPAPAEPATAMSGSFSSR